MNWQLLAQGISAGAGMGSLNPLLAPFMLPLSMIAGTASNFIPTRNSKDYNKPTQPYGVDVTNQLKGSSAFMPQNHPYIHSNNSTLLNPPQYSNQYIYGQKGYNELVNPISGVNSYNLTPPPISQNNINPLQKMPLYTIPTLNPNQFNNVNTNMSSTSPTDTTSTLSPKPFNNRNALLNRANELVPGSTSDTNPELDIYDYFQKNSANIDKMTGRANTYNIAAQSITGLASIASIINELNKKPSQMLQSPEYSTVNLDSNQSAAINYAEDVTGKSKNAQLRMMLDLGIDPTLASTIVNSSANTQMLGAYANAENTRQSINTQQAQINASIQGQANQSLSQTRMFNIQKQMQENQMASANIGQSLMTLAGSVAGIGQGNFANFAGNQYMKNQILSNI